MNDQNFQSSENNKIIQYLSDKSTTFLFLIFSFILVIYAIKSNTGDKYVAAAFYTLFYALIAHYIRIFKNFEPIQNCTAKDKKNLYLYAAIMASLLFWWMNGIVKILSVQNVRINFNNILLVNKFPPSIVILVAIWVINIWYLHNKDQAIIRYIKNIIKDKILRPKKGVADQKINQNFTVNTLDNKEPSQTKKQW
jgi:hypothetical protein